MTDTTSMMTIDGLCWLLTQLYPDSRPGVDWSLSQVVEGPDGPQAATIHSWNLASVAKPSDALLAAAWAAQGAEYRGG